MVSETSMQAYHEEAQKLSRREKEIFDFMFGRGAMTDREIMQRMGYSEPNSVRPRITELVDRGLLEECDRVRCIQTGKTVRRVRLTQPKVDGDGQFLMGF